MPSAPVWRRAVRVTVACAGIVGAFALYAHWQLYLPPECRGDVPEEVPFHQGMTLCPGQTAIITIEVPLFLTEGKDI